MESTGQPLEAGFWKANPHTNIVSVLAPLWKVECPKNEWIMMLPLPPVQQDVLSPGFSLGFFLPVEVSSEIREMQELDRQTVWEKGLKASLGPFTSFPFSICLWSPGAPCYQALGGSGTCNWDLFPSWCESQRLWPLSFLGVCWVFFWLVLMLNQSSVSEQSQICRQFNTLVIQNPGRAKMH